MHRALVTGAGGFIGGHLVKRLLMEGYTVTAVDWKAEYEWYQVHPFAHNLFCRDLSTWSECIDVCRGQYDDVYNLAADMGGMGFIETHKFDCMQSVLINTNMINAALSTNVRRYFYSSSACVYAAEYQTGSNASYPSNKTGADGLAEYMAYPAMPEDGYGWEKLFSERMCRHAYEDRGLEVRVARYHNVYGPHGTYEGGREKAPAALCRKIAECALEGYTELEIWGDGHQQRSFMYIDDCIEGTRRLMESNWTDPINIGSSELVSINQLADRIEAIARTTSAGYLKQDAIPKLHRTHDLTAPQGVRGRNSDNTLIKQVLRWEPQITLNEGLRKTYDWIYAQLASP